MTMPQPVTVDLRPWFLTLHDLQGVVDWEEVFDNEGPVEIDVGCGRGRFLVDASEAHPDRNYLGIEVDYREGRHGAKRLARRKSPNARVWGGDVHAAFQKHVPPASVAAVHVYFPDPWWKRKHRHRRVFNDALVNEMTYVLQPGGLVHAWTDVEEYFGVISALMDNDPRYETLPPPAEKPAEHDLDYRTSFERKKRQAGYTIYRGRWRLVERVVHAFSTA